MDVGEAELATLEPTAAVDCGTLAVSVAALPDAADEPDDWETTKALDAGAELAVAGPDDDADERPEVVLPVAAGFDAEDDPADETEVVAESVDESGPEAEVPVIEDADEPVAVLLLEVSVLVPVVPVGLLPVKLPKLAAEVLDPAAELLDSLAVVLDPGDALLDPTDTDPINELVLVIPVVVVERAAASMLSLIFLRASA